MKRYIVWIVVTIIYNVNVLAQPYCHTRTFTNHEGLGSNIISSIQQTRDGLMWFASWNGLCCYDGYNFKTFRDDFAQKEILTTNRLFKLDSNSQDDLWCITYDRQLNLFDTHTCEFIDYSKLILEKYPESKNFRARSIYPLAKGVTWVVGDDNEKFSFRIIDKKKGEKESIEKMEGVQILRVRQDYEGREWLLTDKGIMLWGTNKRNAVRYIHMNEFGKTIILASATRHLAYYENGKFHPIALPSDISKIYRMRRRGETIYLATNQGVLVYHPAKRNIQRFSVRHPNHTSNEVQELFIDKAHRIWALTGKEGVILIHPEDGSLEWLQAEASNLTTTTTSKVAFFHQDQHGTVWISPTNGIFSYYDEALHKLVAASLRSHAWSATALPYLDRYFTDANGNIWFAGQHDLNVVNFKYRRVHEHRLRPGQEVRSVCYDDKGKLWIGGSEGRVMICDAKGNIEGYLNSHGKIQKAETIFSYRIYAIHQDSKHRMWIGTKGNGLYRIDPEGIRHFVHEDSNPYSLSHNDVYDIFEDSKRRIWIATYAQGVNMVEENEHGDIRFIHPHNQLVNYPQDYMKVRRITRTKQGVLILSTSHGMVTFSENFASPRSVHFYANKHVQGDTTTLRSSDVLQTYVTKGGIIYVTTMGGGLQRVKSQNLLQEKIEYGKVNLALSESANSLVGIIEDKQGMLWLVRESCIDRYEPKTGKISRFSTDGEDEHFEYSEANPAINPSTGEISLGQMGG